MNSKTSRSLPARSTPTIPAGPVPSNIAKPASFLSQHNFNRVHGFFDNDIKSVKAWPWLSSIIPCGDGGQTYGGGDADSGQSSDGGEVVSEDVQIETAYLKIIRDGLDKVTGDKKNVCRFATLS
jgi:hypothetical protein